LGLAGISKSQPGRHIRDVLAGIQEYRLSRNIICNMSACIICRPNLVDILCRNRRRPDYPAKGRWSGICVRDRANGSILDTEVNREVMSLQSRKEPSQVWEGVMMTECIVVVYQPPQCKGQYLQPQWSGQCQGSTRYKHGMSHREQSGESQGWQRLVSLSYLVCSACHLPLGDRCNPRHEHIRWPREP
jgi:hypothetical protein